MSDDYTEYELKRNMIGTLFFLVHILFIFGDIVYNVVHLLKYNSLTVDNYSSQEIHSWSHLLVMFVTMYTMLNLIIYSSFAQSYKMVRKITQCQCVVLVFYRFQ